VRRELEGTSGAADRKLQDLETQRRVADELEKLRAKVGQKAERDESAAESGS
jgi:hypothetical protein